MKLTWCEELRKALLGGTYSHEMLVDNKLLGVSLVYLHCPRLS